jgi:hypothetical protein
MEETQGQCSVNCVNLLCRQKNSIHTVRTEYGVAVLRKENEPEELSTMLRFGAAVTHDSQFCESRFMVGGICLYCVKENQCHTPS